MHASTRSPAYSGRIPRIHCVTATKLHAAVPVNHEFLASPGAAASRPAIVCAYTYGSQRCTSLWSSRADGLINTYDSNARSPSPARTFAIVIHGFVWQKTLAFSLYPGGYELISPSSA